MKNYDVTSSDGPAGCGDLDKSQLSKFMVDELAYLDGFVLQEHASQTSCEKSDPTH